MLLVFLFTNIAKQCTIVCKCFILMGMSASAQMIINHLKKIVCSATICTVELCRARIRTIKRACTEHTVEQNTSRILQQQQKQPPEQQNIKIILYFNRFFCWRCFCVSGGIMIPISLCLFYCYRCHCCSLNFRSIDDLFQFLWQVYCFGFTVKIRFYYSEKETKNRPLRRMALTFSFVLDSIKAISHRNICIAFIQCSSFHLSFSHQL